MITNNLIHSVNNKDIDLLIKNHQKQYFHSLIQFKIFKEKLQNFE